jgi:hypothetical protein
MAKRARPRTPTDARPLRAHTRALSARCTGSEAMLGVVILSMDIGMDAIGMDIYRGVLWPAWRPHIVRRR